MGREGIKARDPDGSSPTTRASGKKSATPELTLINPGVHFPGSAVLHWSAGDGALFTGDVVNVCPDNRWVTLMYSYANHIPERPQAVRAAADLLAGYRFERIYGAWWHRVVASHGNEVLARSVARCLRFEQGTVPGD